MTDAELQTIRLRLSHGDIFPNSVIVSLVAEIDRLKKYECAIKNLSWETGIPEHKLDIMPKGPAQEATP